LLVESDETNNVLPVPITLGPIADLAVTAASKPAPTDGTSALDVSFTVTNQGPAPASRPSWSDAVYLPPKPTPDSTARQRHEQTRFNSSPLAALSSYTVDAHVFLPSDAAGSLYLLFVTDKYGQQADSDPSDNVMSMPLTVLAPDLELSNPSAPSSVTLG